MASTTSTTWRELADRVLAGHRISPEEGLAVLRAADEELLDLLAAAYRVRHRWFGNRVDLNFLINAKSGLCSEDCGYCSQSRVSKAEIAHYPLVTAERVLDGAAQAARRRSKTYCAVISGRAPTDGELDTLAQVVPAIKADYGLKVCFSVGLLGPEQARRLKAAGVDRVNHNLNTSERFYPTICTTHSYQERLETLRNVRLAGLEICSGGIVGMGEEDADVVELALRLGQLQAEAVPVNFLLPIAGVPLEAARRQSGHSQRSEESSLPPVRHSQRSEESSLPPVRHSQRSEESSLPPVRHSQRSEESSLPPVRHSERSEESSLPPVRHSERSEESSLPRDSTEILRCAQNDVDGAQNDVDGAQNDARCDSSPPVSRPLSPRYCLKVLALFRLANPSGELRMAAGRELHLGPLQPLGLFAANSMFVGGYLTEPGQPPADDYRMIEALGFTLG